MANKVHRQRRKEGVNVWNTWREECPKEAALIIASATFGHSE